MTEVNMNVATYIKFDDITNALVDVKPTRLAELASGAREPVAAPQAPGRQQLLDTSFNVRLTLGGALDRLLGQQQQQQAGGQGATAHQQTPALGK